MKVEVVEVVVVVMVVVVGPFIRINTPCSQLAELREDKIFTITMYIENLKFITYNG